MKKQSGRDLHGWALSIILSVTAQAWAVLPTNEKSDVLLSTMQQRALRGDLVAAGDDIYIENRPTLVPHSIVAPSILFDELVVKTRQYKQRETARIPRPDRRSSMNHAPRPFEKWAATCAGAPS
jgi:hypothetical protein